jgi:hypothetical protein
MTTLARSGGDKRPQCDGECRSGHGVRTDSRWWHMRRDAAWLHPRRDEGYWKRERGFGSCSMRCIDRVQLFFARRRGAPLSDRLFDQFVVKQSRKVRFTRLTFGSALGPYVRPSDRANSVGVEDGMRSTAASTVSMSRSVRFSSTAAVPSPTGRATTDAMGRPRTSLSTPMKKPPKGS